MADPIVLPSMQELLIYVVAILFGVDKGIPAFKNWKNGRTARNNFQGNQRIEDLRDADKKYITRDLCEEKTKHFGETLEYVKGDVREVKANVQELLRRTQNP